MYGGVSNLHLWMARIPAIKFPSVWQVLGFLLAVSSKWLVPGKGRYKVWWRFEDLWSLWPLITAQIYGTVFIFHFHLLLAARWPFSMPDHAQEQCGRAKSWSDNQRWAEDIQLLSISTARWNPGIDRPTLCIMNLSSLSHGNHWSSALLSQRYIVPWCLGS